MSNVTLMNLEKMGYREIQMVQGILNAYLEQGLPSDFYDDGVTIEFNPNSGYVFLTNSDYQVAMLRWDKLESWYCTPYNGYAGYVDELLDELENSPDDWHEEEVEFLYDMLVNYYPDLMDRFTKIKEEYKLEIMISEEE